MFFAFSFNGTWRFLAAMLEVLECPVSSSFTSWQNAFYPYWFYHEKETDDGFETISPMVFAMGELLGTWKGAAIHEIDQEGCCIYIKDQKTIEFNLTYNHNKPNVMNLLIFTSSLQVITKLLVKLDEVKEELGLDTNDLISRNISPTAVNSDAKIRRYHELKNLSVDFYPDSQSKDRVFDFDDFESIPDLMEAIKKASGKDVIKGLSENSSF